MASSSLNCLSNSYSCSASTDMVSPWISQSGREGEARQDEKRNIQIVSALIRAPTQPRPLSCIALAAARNSFSRSPMSVYMPSTSNRHTPSCLRSGIKVLKPSDPGPLRVSVSPLYCKHGGTENVVTNCFSDLCHRYDSGTWKQINKCCARLKSFHNTVQIV